ncbi:hypothetical protein ACLMLE_00555 [Lysobacter capsici]
MRTYLASVEQALKTRQAGEHTHRPALEPLLEALGGPEVDAINEPRQIKCGAPDFIVVRGTVPLGQVEAKDVGLDLAKLERGDQLTRYRGSLGNLVFTDCLSFPADGLRSVKKYVGPLSRIWTVPMPPVQKLLLRMRATLSDRRS